MTDKKTSIQKSAKLLFISKGFKDTNVAEITKMAGMATGTFYNYYPSKDKLFMDIFLEENIKLKKSIMDSIDLDAHPIDIMKKMIYLNIEGMSANPILSEWYNRDVAAKIEKIYRDENGIDNLDFLYDSFIDIVRKWQDDGTMRKDIDAEMVMAMFTALINVETHKDEIGLKYFPQVIEHMVEFTMQGLTTFSKESS